MPSAAPEPAPRHTITKTLTRPDATFERDTDEVEEQEPGDVAHIVRADDGETAAAVVLRARIEGTPITALCGHVFIPQRDPKVLPVCAKCKEIYDMERMFDPNLHENPRY